jgi:hypothetical protein
VHNWVLCIMAGLTTTALSRVLGKPSHVARPWLSYNFQTKVIGKGQCEGGFDRLNSLDVMIQDGAVIAISTDQVTSC